MDENLQKIGLLMETALTYQNLADEALARLKSHTQGLDGIVREEVRRTFIEELLALTEESGRTVQAMQSAKRAVNTSMALWTVLMTILCTGIAGAIAWWTLPSKTEIAALRTQHDRYAAAVAQLERRGGRIELRRCANDTRLCVRIDSQAQAFGPQGDYRVIQGY